MTSEIILIQNPIIKHELDKVGQAVTERLEALNIEGQAATEETVKYLKELRAELNKELADYELQRKAIKNAVLSPYDELEASYKLNVSDKYKQAIDVLKDKIAEVEDRVKADKLEEVKSYFVEAVLAADIDFLSFPQTNIKIDLSTSMKKYREQVDEFVGRVVSDLALIETQEHKAEILVEYKKSLNVSTAITTITTRKEAEKAERIRIKVAETDRRIKQLQTLSMVFHELTRTYNYVGDESVMISLNDIENLPKDEFNARLLEMAAKIKPEPKEEKLQAPVQVAPQQQVAPVVEPTANAEPELFTAKFEVIATYEKLKMLGIYMKANSITYKNVE